ncbi:uncharacterized protein LY79DRAFT_571072 [Colletotrichum navitas]|uniref:Uncharacterized protein n=1 Tax=Colletotrichum navitas TaxID=681940 RepID=A0AAD8PLY1_9PEZI|nr:uncharacterized protein LY79DRAFT_571072 [Colletotrichum navitas]KAK1569842.1 hypothetical protein LY79DRAFT_571072 [Colletotrichum navitas]
MATTMAERVYVRHPAELAGSFPRLLRPKDEVFAPTGILRTKPKERIGFHLSFPGFLAVVSFHCVFNSGGEGETHPLAAPRCTRRVGKERKFCVGVQRCSQDARESYTYTLLQTVDACVLVRKKEKKKGSEYSPPKNRINYCRKARQRLRQG